VFLPSPQKSRAICIHEQVEKSGVQELQNETAASGLWMVINDLHAMKNHAGARSESPVVQMPKSTRRCRRR
jgi:hypothetical protein